MAEITIQTERESPRGWLFEVAIDQNGTAHTFEVTLSWSDYDLWSRGQIAPQHVVRTAFVFLLEREPVAAIFRRFDCAVIRRYFPEVDKRLPTMLSK